MNPISFLKEVKGELTKVTWPSRQQTVQATVIVIIISVIVGVYVGGLDFVFTSLMNTLLK